jgi:hypothetical protein
MGFDTGKLRVMNPRHIPGLINRLDYCKPELQKLNLNYVLAGRVAVGDANGRGFERARNASYL